MEGVGSRPEAEGWIEGGGIGLKAPWEMITRNLGHEDRFIWVFLNESYCISEAGLLVGMFQLLLEGDSCSRDESCTTIGNKTTELQRQRMGTPQVRRTDPAGM